MAVDHPCPLCGHSLVGHQVGSRCPECSLLIVPGASITRPRELFIIGIRLIGVWYLIIGFQWAIGLIELLIDVGVSAADTTVGEYVWAIVMDLVISVYCLLGAPHVVGMAYGHHLARETAPESDAPDDSE